MGCTYKTNKYRLPLLHILDCTNLQTFFSAGYCFLHGEKQEDYYWALSTFLHRINPSPPKVFISDQEDALKSAALELMPEVPQILCVWHISMNALSKAQYVWRDRDSSMEDEKVEIAEMRTDFMAQ